MEHAFGAIPQGGGGSLPTAELLQLLQTVRLGACP